MLVRQNLFTIHQNALGFVVLAIVFIGPTFAILLPSLMWWIWFAIPASLLSIFKTESSLIIDESARVVKHVISFFKWRCDRLVLEFSRVIRIDVEVDPQNTLEDTTGFAVHNKTILHGFIIKMFITYVEDGTTRLDMPLCRFYFENKEPERAELMLITRTITRLFPQTDVT
jgi:hypothetical protein